MTATPINNSLTDLKNQLLLGTGGDTNRFYINYIDDTNLSRVLNWADYIQQIRTDLNKEIRETGTFNKDNLKNQIAPIIRQFVVRRTRQGILERYGNLAIEGKVQKFPNVNAELLNYSYKNIE